MTFKIITNEYRINSGVIIAYFSIKPKEWMLFYRRGLFNDALDDLEIDAAGIFVL
jgi:hypothetical protein